LNIGGSNQFADGRPDLDTVLREAGMPLSMLLFALCLNPLIHRLEQLNGVRVLRQQHKTALVAYADDVSIFVKTTEDLASFNEAIRCFERATVAVLNVRKSKALAVGT
jgi:hypothetical protein